MDFALLLGRRLSRNLFVPLMARTSLRRLQPYEITTVETIKNVLRVNKSEAMTIYRRGAQSIAGLRFDFFFMSRFNQRTLQKDLDLVQVFGAERLPDLLASDSPVLIITMHMGNFPLGFLKLVSSVEGKRKFFVFKANQKNNNEDSLFTLFRQQSLEIEALYAGEDGGKKAYQELRKGNVVIMMVDFEVYVTSMANVTFFDQICQMQAGPATLAVLSKAVIVPIVNFKNTSGQATIKVESPLYTKKISLDETNQQVIVRLTQEIASLQESWIRIAPSQVQSWIGIARTIRRINSDSKVKILNP